MSGDSSKPGFGPAKHVPMQGKGTKSIRSNSQKMEREHYKTQLTHGECIL